MHLVGFIIKKKGILFLTYVAKKEISEKRKIEKQFG